MLLSVQYSVCRQSSNSINMCKKTPLSFKSKVVYEKSQTPLTSYEKDYIDRFEEGYAQDSYLIGEGVTAKAYYSPNNNFVIKQHKYNQYVPEKRREEMGSLAYENEMLLKIDPNVKTTQRGRAYVETEDGGKFLISSFVDGKPADRYTNPFTEKHIDRLLRNLYRLDKSKIIHSDLSRPNLLLDQDNNVNIIDYQWADVYNIYEKYSNFALRNSFYPYFESPNNASMFEAAGLAGYVKQMPTSGQEDFLKKYYVNKIDYIEKNIHRLEDISKQHCENLTDTITFDKSRVKAYGSIDSSILEAEVLKMNILNLHRRQYSCYDENKVEPRNILRTIPLTIRAKECAELLANHQGKYSCDETYHSYMRKYGEFWLKNMRNWYTASLKWIFKLMAKEECDPAKIMFPNKFNDFSNLDIVSGSNSVNIPRIYKKEDLKLREIFQDAYTFGKNSKWFKKDEAFKTIERIFAR
ncbi:MAG: hypothetical protein MJ231_03050 [bacterium]|nr:hypothetical protein [bacterium]